MKLIKMRIPRKVKKRLKKEAFNVPFPDVVSLIQVYHDFFESWYYKKTHRTLTKYFQFWIENDLCDFIIDRFYYGRLV